MKGRGRRIQCESGGGGEICESGGEGEFSVKGRGRRIQCEEEVEEN